MLNKNEELGKGMEIKAGEYIKLGRVWFKIKETSDTAKDLTNTQIQRQSLQECNSENTEVIVTENNFGHGYK